MGRKTRKEIREMFANGVEPSGQDFSDFTDSILISTDDGIYKPNEESQPIRISSSGDEQNVLDFYDSEDNHFWRINQYPQDTCEDGNEVQRAGLNIEDSTNESRFFIKQENGNIGISTANPQAKLHVVQKGSDTDAFRVDDADNDTTPFVINGNGCVKIRVNPENYDEKLSLDVRGPVRFVNMDGKRRSFEIYKGTDISPYDGEPDLTVDTDGDSIFDKPEPAFSVTEDGAVGIGTDAPESGVSIKGNLRAKDNLIVEKDMTINGSLTVEGNVYSRNVDQTLAIKDVRLGDQDDDTVTVNGEILSSNSTGSLCINDSVNIKEKTVIGSSYYQNSAVNICDAAPSNGLIVEGNVGIGFTSPSAKLAVNGGAHIGGESDPGDNTLLVDGDLKAKGTVKEYHSGGYYDLVPAGSIIMWHGASVPYGWAICNGSNGTPNLIDKFILGSTAPEDITDSHNDRQIVVNHKIKSHTHKVTESAHTHTLNSIPNHTHSLSTASHKHSFGIDDHTHELSLSTGLHTHESFTVYDYFLVWNSGTSASGVMNPLGSGSKSTYPGGGVQTETTAAGGSSSKATTPPNGASAETSGAGGLNKAATTSVGDGSAPSSTFDFDVIPKHYRLLFIMKL